MSFSLPPTPAKTKGKTTGTSSTSSSDVTQYTLNQIQGVATTAFESALGREPTDAELKTFLDTLNQYAKEHPATSSGSKTSSDTSTTTSKTVGKNVKKQTQTNTTTGTSSADSSSTSVGGVDVSNLIDEQLKGSTEAQAVKTDNIFTNALQLLANRLGG